MPNPHIPPRKEALKKSEPARPIPHVKLSDTQIARAIRAMPLKSKLKMLSNPKDLSIGLFRRACKNRGLNPEGTFATLYSSLVLYPNGDFQVWVGEIQGAIGRSIETQTGKFVRGEIDKPQLVSELQRIRLQEVRSYAEAFAYHLRKKDPAVMAYLGLAPANKPQ